MMTQNNMRAVLEAHPIIPVVTFNSIEEVDPLVDHLLEQNIRCIEITLRTAAAMECIQYLLDNRSQEIAVGVGTVIRPEQAQQLDSMGVAFMVSPGLSPALAEAFKACKVPFIPGVATPSEIITALSNGFDTLKFFPANLFGVMASLKAYGQVFPEVRFCPTGGISGANYEEFLALENVISVGGSWVVK
jgi:2-dehydro-3-deoxyphosphogluconate aldolase/(4S)-4-hydroxy-2-oxoglutarate aldolase